MFQRVVFPLIIQPLLWIVLGIRVRNSGALPKDGPAIIVANHNSHLDTLVLLSLVPGSVRHKYRPAAAADYFFHSRIKRWIGTRLLRIIPLDRGGAGARAALDPVRTALATNEIVIIYPEGSRGAPETMARFRRGVALLIAEFPEVPVYPVFLYGLGRALPKGEKVPVPFFCDVAIGQAQKMADVPRREIPNHLAETIANLGVGLASDWHEGPTESDNDA
ncbi:MAG: lysophospholipid acyltransferase family protein [Pseudomonadota bacterium]